MVILPPAAFFLAVTLENFPPPAGGEVQAVFNGQKGEGNDAKTQPEGAAQPQQTGWGSKGGRAAA
jgi:hypothetical protein